MIASLVLHEVESLSAGIKEIMRVLKPGGQYLCLEWQKKEMEQGPALDHRLGLEELQQAFQEEGFTIVEHSFPAVVHYLIVVEK